MKIKIYDKSGKSQKLKIDEIVQGCVDKENIALSLDNEPTQNINFEEHMQGLKWWERAAGYILIWAYLRAYLYRNRRLKYPRDERKLINKLTRNLFIEQDARMPKW